MAKNRRGGRFAERRVVLIKVQGKVPAPLIASKTPERQLAAGFGLGGVQAHRTADFVGK